MAMRIMTAPRTTSMDAMRELDTGAAIAGAGRNAVLIRVAPDFWQVVSAGSAIWKHRLDGWASKMFVGIGPGVWRACENPHFWQVRPEVGHPAAEIHG